MRRDSKSQGDSKNTTRSKVTTCSIFSTAGSPKGPNLEKFQDLKFSSEIENFKRATHQTPIFCGEFWRSGLKFSSEIEKFQARLKISSEIEFFSRFGPLGSFGQLGMSCQRLQLKVPRKLDV